METEEIDSNDNKINELGNLESEFLQGRDCVLSSVESWHLPDWPSPIRVQQKLVHRMSE